MSSNEYGGVSSFPLIILAKENPCVAKRPPGALCRANSAAEDCPAYYPGWMQAAFDSSSLLYTEYLVLFAARAPERAQGLVPGGLPALQRSLV